MTDDPLHGSSARYGDLLTTGRVLHETLTSIEHYRDALNVIETLDHAQLAHLALYVAADAAATRGQERPAARYGSTGGVAWTASTRTASTRTTCQPRARRLRGQHRGCSGTSCGPTEATTPTGHQTPNRTPEFFYRCTADIRHRASQKRCICN